MLDCVVADTDGAGFPIFQQFGQCLPALVPDLWNGPVDQVEIEVFQSETLEARVTSLQRRFVSVVAVPQLGRYEHVIAFDTALAEGGANVGFVVVDSCGVDVAISYLQRVFYCFLGYLAWGDWYTPRPRRGIMTPLLSLASGSTVACMFLLDYLSSTSILPEDRVCGLPGATTLAS